MDTETATQTRDARRASALAGRVAVGHPVDVATGAQFTAAHDIEVAGVAPLIFRRVYDTRFLPHPPTVLGPGWVHSFDAALEKDLDGFTFQGHDGERVELDDIDNEFAARGSLSNPSASMELRREGERLAVYHWHDVNEPVQKYVFDSRPGGRMLLIARTLPSGQGIEVGRDPMRRVVTLTQNVEQRRLYIRYDDAGRLESLRLGLASHGIEGSRQVARYRYDAAGRLVSVEDALGAARHYGYDDAGRLILERDRQGGTYRMRYDALGRCIESSGDGAHQQRRFIYEPGQTTRVIDGLGHETLYQYNSLGQVEREIKPDGATSVTEFDDAGRIARQVNPIGATTSYVYDERGHLAAKVFANGARLTYEYDEFHQPAKVVEPDGGTWSFGYQRGALVDVTDPFGARVHFVRALDNQLMGAVTSAGQELRVRTNDTWTEEIIEDDLGLVVRRELDVYLNAVRTEDAEGPISCAEYDRLGRVSRFELPDGNARHFEYDGEGRVVRMVDGRGAEWRARYSSYGDCIEQIDPLGRVHRFRWDEESRLTAIENPQGEKARFEYDRVGNLCRVAHFDGSVERAEYDLAARLVNRTRPDGKQLTFSRDVVGNLLAIECGGEQLRRFEYDLCGSPSRAQTPDADVVRQYAVGGRLLSETQNGRRVEYEYGSRGFLVKRSFDGSKAGPLFFEHDLRGRLRRFSTERGDEQTYRYDLRDRCTERKLGPRSESRKYDLQGRLRHQDVRGIATRAFEYDAEGALIDVMDRLRGRKQFSYDRAGQLLGSINERLGAHHYGYDGNGNLVRKDADGLRYDSGNRLEQIGRAKWQRDPNGQLVRQVSPERDDAYQWDPLGQLRCVRDRNGAETRFGYDAFGRRVFKHYVPAPPREAPPDPLAGCAWAVDALPGEPRDRLDAAPRHLSEGRTDYYWAGDDLLAEAHGGHLTEYAMWRFVADALWEDGRLRHVINSQQGVPQELLDADGRLVWAGTFDDWGRLLDEEGSTTCRLRLPGQLADDETGLHYNRFRYYSPDAGQFISPDPLGLAGEANEYRFAPDAINWIDPFGLKCGETGCKTGAKRGPKTDPNAPHNARIRLEADLLEAQGNTIIAGGGREKERLIPTPGGAKRGRRPDILYETPDGQIKGRNVGRTMADGSPVPREVSALSDLNNHGGVPTDFVGYD